MAKSTLTNVSSYDYQFKRATKFLNDFFEIIFFWAIWKIGFIISFYNKIMQITIILKDLNKFPTTQLVYYQMWQSSYGWLSF
jgi:hypothetical protein